MHAAKQPTRLRLCISVHKILLKIKKYIIAKNILRGIGREKKGEMDYEIFTKMKLWLFLSSTFLIGLASITEILQIMKKNPISSLYPSQAQSREESTCHCSTIFNTQQLVLSLDGPGLHIYASAVYIILHRPNSTKSDACHKHKHVQVDGWSHYLDEYKGTSYLLWCYKNFG